jgi:hypothetical protein
MSRCSWRAPALPEVGRFALEMEEDRGRERDLFALERRQRRLGWLPLSLAQSADLEGGKVLEHWDVIQPIPESSSASSSITIRVPARV